MKRIQPISIQTPHRFVESKPLHGLESQWSLMANIFLDVCSWNVAPGKWNAGWHERKLHFKWKFWVNSLTNANLYCFTILHQLSQQVPVSVSLFGPSGGNHTEFGVWTSARGLLIRRRCNFAQFSMPILFYYALGHLAPELRSKKHRRNFNCFSVVYT